MPVSITDCGHIGTVRATLVAPGAAEWGNAPLPLQRSERRRDCSDRQRGLARMITPLCDRLGTLCVTWPQQVLAMCGVLTLLTIPLVMHL
jgi:hypothetical protein